MGTYIIKMKLRKGSCVAWPDFPITFCFQVPNITAEMLVSKDPRILHLHGSSLLHRQVSMASLAGFPTGYELLEDRVPRFAQLLLFQWLAQSPTFNGICVYEKNAWVTMAPLLWSLPRPDEMPP